MTKIQWTDATWNPVLGCSPVSPGCLNCYAAGMAHRGMTPAHNGLAVVRNGRAVFNGTVRTRPDKLIEPLRWRKPRRVFVCSMSDLFHEAVPREYQDQLFGIMLACAALTGHKHTFQVLTKRPERAAQYLTERTPAELLRAWSEAADQLVTVDDGGVYLSEIVEALCRYHWGKNGAATDDPGDWGAADNLFPLPNAWLGTSAENQATLNERLPHLLRCPAAVRFLSLEPLLEEVSLTLMRHENDWDPPSVPEGIGWVIVGGESGPKARPFNLEWARSVRDQCKAAGVPLFFKQAGSRPYLVDRRGNIGFRGKEKYGLVLPDGFYRHLNDRKGGDPAEWPEDLRVREWPKGGEA